jgi:hypothetical protein
MRWKDDYNEQIGIWGEIILVYFKALSWHSSGKTEENHKKIQ